MNDKIEHLLKVLESWEKAYLSPSATMAITEAKDTIKALYQEVNMLDTLVAELRSEIEELKTTKALESNVKKSTRKTVKNEE